MLKITPERPLCSAKTERYAIVHGNGKYIAVDKRGYMNTSSDGRTWSNPDIIGCPADWHLLHLPAVNMWRPVTDMLQFLLMELIGALIRSVTPITVPGMTSNIATDIS